MGLENASFKKEDCLRCGIRSRGAIFIMYGSFDITCLPEVVSYSSMAEKTSCDSGLKLGCSSRS